MTATRSVAPAHNDAANAATSKPSTSAHNNTHDRLDPNHGDAASDHPS